MAMRVQDVILGVDVSKEWVDVHVWGTPGSEQLPNRRRELRAWLKRHPGAALAVEATNTFHETLVDLAQELGITVYLISGFQLKRYAEAVGERMRNDATDAELLARYLNSEIDQLRPYRPKSPVHRQLWRLLKYRALLVRNRRRLIEGARGVPHISRQIKALLDHHDRHLALLERQMLDKIQALGWQNDMRRLSAVPGIGKITAIALVVAYRSGTFVHRDAFVAYLGLDVRAKDSGKKTGRRKLSKKGDPEYRRLLHCAAMSSRSEAYFREFFERHLARGMARTAALVALARKLVRVAYSLLKNDAEFSVNRLRRA